MNKKLYFFLRIIYLPICIMLIWPLLAGFTLAISGKFIPGMALFLLSLLLIMTLFYWVRSIPRKWLIATTDYLEKNIIKLGVAPSFIIRHKLGVLLWGIDTIAQKIIIVNHQGNAECFNFEQIKGFHVTDAHFTLQTPDTQRAITVTHSDVTRCELLLKQALGCNT